jgi:citrate synthase
MIRSEQGGDEKRQRRYSAEDIERLLVRKESRRNPETLAKDALHWGAPLMDSAITLIDGGKLYYRGKDVEKLALEHSVEEVAALVWTGSMADAARLFTQQEVVSAYKYEMMLVHVGLDGAELSPIQDLQTCLPAIAADDPGAYDLRPATVATNGARLLCLMASILAGEVPENLPISQMLQLGWCAQNPDAAHLLNVALIVLADHELNASSFTARVVASAGSTLYAVVLAGLAALEGVKHGGHIERVEALFSEIDAGNSVREVLTGRMRRGEVIPGFGHTLYPQGDPRARLLLSLLAEQYGEHPQYQSARAIIQAVHELIGEDPAIDVALVVLARVLELPPGSALALFALGRTIGWIGHAIEQYQQDRLIRPRARYTGELPS